MAQRLLPHSDIVIGLGIVETAHLPIPTSSEHALARLIAEPDGTLSDSGTALFCLLLCPSDESLAQAFPFMSFSHKEMAQLPLIPLGLLDLDARYHHSVLLLDEIVV
jgi:hypothetical protein